jgi:hypothetical protein
VAERRFDFFLMIEKEVEVEVEVERLKARSSSAFFSLYSLARRFHHLFVVWPLPAPQPILTWQVPSQGDVEEPSGASDASGEGSAKGGVDILWIALVFSTEKKERGSRFSFSLSFRGRESLSCVGERGDARDARDARVELERERQRERAKESERQSTREEAKASLDCSKRRENEDVFLKKKTLLLTFSPTSLQSFSIRSLVIVAMRSPELSFGSR